MLILGCSYTSFGQECTVPSPLLPTASSINGWHTTNNEFYGQTFVACSDGFITSIAYQYNGSNNTTAQTPTLFIENGVADGFNTPSAGVATADYSQVFSAEEGMVPGNLDTIVLTTPFPVSAGQTYSFYFQKDKNLAENTNYFIVEGQQNNLYTDGFWFYASGTGTAAAWGPGTWDLYFDVKIVAELFSVTKEVAIEDDLNMDGQINPGEEIKYTITVRNNTGAVLGGTMLIDTLDENFLHTNTTTTFGSNPGNSPVIVDFGQFPAGSTEVVCIYGTITNPLASGVTTLCNQAYLKSAMLTDSILSDDTNDPTSDADSTCSALSAAPDLVITKVGSEETYIAGLPYTYTIDYSNNGSQDATGVIITETVPTGTTFNASLSSAGWDCMDGATEGSICNYNVGMLSGGGAGGTVTFGINTQISTKENPLINVVLIADDGANGSDLNESNNAFTLASVRGAQIPTIGQWGLIILSLILVIFGVRGVIRKKHLTMAE